MKLEGEIGEIDLTTRLVELWREQFTGAIRFESDGIIKIIYFKGGDVLSASTNDRSDSIDEILMRAGKVTRDHVKQALAKRKESETLGDALLNLGFITRKELTWARRVQVIGVIRSITTWANGSFTIVSDYLPKREEGTLFATPQIIVEMVVTEQDRARFERALEGGALVYGKTPAFDIEFERLGLNDEAARIASAIDGARSASEVAVASGQDAFNTYKLLHALAVLRLLERRDGGTALPTGELDFAGVGVADASDAWNFDPSPDAGSSLNFDTTDLPPLGGANSFDESPALETPAYSAPAGETPSYDAAPAAAAPSPSYDSFADESAPAAPASGGDYWSSDEEEAAPAAMPTWGAPAAAASVATSSAHAEEEKWGFDEAQIEAAQKMSAPLSGEREPVKLTNPRAEKKGRRGAIVAIVALLVLAGGGYAAFLWWQGRQNAATEVATPVRRPRPATTTEMPVPVATATETTGTIVEGTATTTSGVAPNTAAPATTATAATATAPPVRVTAEAPIAVPAPPVASTPVVPSGAGRERYDAMARQFAANPSGKFAVQLVIVCETSNLEKAMKAGGDNVWFTPISVKGRSCYRVFWGHYGSREEASRAVAQVPNSLRESRPVAVPIPKG